MARNTTTLVRTAKRAVSNRKLTAVAVVLAAATITLMDLCATPRAKHTSILTGAKWVRELIFGHSGRFREQLGVSRTVFRKLCQALQKLPDQPLRNGWYVKVDEQVAIFLHFARTGLSSSMLQERFQRSGDTISK